eukprot:2942817-Alexandrium_andersonii.AAC.1
MTLPRGHSCRRANLAARAAGLLPWSMAATRTTARATHQRIAGRDGVDAWQWPRSSRPEKPSG